MYPVTLSCSDKPTEEISNATDNNTYAVGMFIDLKKACDSINHEILIKWNAMESGEHNWSGVVFKTGNSL